MSAAQTPKVAISLGALVRCTRRSLLTTKIRDKAEEGGVEIVELSPDGLGISCGLRVGDVVISVDGTELPDVARIVSLYFGKRKRQTKLQVRRNASIVSLVLEKLDPVASPSRRSPEQRGIGILFERTGNPEVVRYVFAHHLITFQDRKSDR